MPERARASLTNGMPPDAFSSMDVVDLDPEEGKATCLFVADYMNLPQSFPEIGETKAELPTKGKSPLPLLDPLAVSSILDPLY